MTTIVVADSVHTRHFSNFGWGKARWPSPTTAWVRDNEVGAAGRSRAKCGGDRPAARWGTGDDRVVQATWTLPPGSRHHRLNGGLETGRGLKRHDVVGHLDACGHKRTLYRLYWLIEGSPRIVLARVAPKAGLDVDAGTVGGPTATHQKGRSPRCLERQNRPQLKRTRGYQDLRVGRCRTGPDASASSASMMSASAPIKRHVAASRRPPAARGFLPVAIRTLTNHGQ